MSGANTRRYHGLLVASLHPPADRIVILSKLEETLLVGNQRFELAANQFPQTINPKGHYFIQARLNVNLPGIDRDTAQKIVDGAHLECPYSKATHGNIAVVTNIADTATAQSV